MKNYLKKIDRILEFEPDPAFARRARIILGNLDLNGNEKILEVGCGRGFYLRALKEVWPGLEIVGVDINQKYLTVAKCFLNDLKIKLVRANATNLPFENKTFDWVIVTEILEHLADDRKAILEIFRVKKPQGGVIVTVPNKKYPFFWDPLNWVLENFFNWHIPSKIWWLAGIWADHFRLYGEKELRDKFEKSGFKVEKVWRSTRYCFPFSHFLFYGIGKNLVEKGFLRPFNRFEKDQQGLWLNKLLLWPVRAIDRLNSKDKNCSAKASVNLIFKLANQDNGF